MSVTKCGSELEASPTKTTELAVRTWVAEPRGRHDRMVDIWFNDQWVPAWFSDVRAGDFWATLDGNLEIDKCFRAASDAKPIGKDRNGDPSFIILKGCEIVQAPSISELRDINALPTSSVNKLAISNNVPLLKGSTNDATE